MRPRLLARSCALPSCKFAASRLNIKRHYALLQQWAFDVHCIALSRGQNYDAGRLDIFRTELCDRSLRLDCKGWNDGWAEAAVKHVLG